MFFNSSISADFSSIITNKKQRSNSTSILLVISHPDDEVMFFSPLLHYAAVNDNNIKIWILCLSTGNYEGLGQTRVKELKKCGSIYNITTENINIIDHNQLQDGMNNNWSIKLISDIVHQQVLLINPSAIFTFDEYGVSNHPNHIATYHGVRYYFMNVLIDKTSISGYKLNSKNLFRKFIGLFDIIFICIFHGLFIINIFGLYKAYKGMFAHSSQNVWYRKIFIFFSSFTYINSYSKIN